MINKKSLEAFTEIKDIKSCSKEFFYSQFFQNLKNWRNISPINTAFLANFRHIQIQAQAGSTGPGTWTNNRHLLSKLDKKFLKYFRNPWSKGSIHPKILFNSETLKIYHAGHLTIKCFNESGPAVPDSDRPVPVPVYDIKQSA